MFIQNIFSPFEHSLFLIRLVSLLVPALFRDSWRSEWEAEVWHAWHSMRDRGETPAFGCRSQLNEFCKGSLADAAWYRWNMFDREETVRAARNWMRSPGFCLGSLATVILLLGLLSGFFPTTRAILMPLPYVHADRIATVSRTGFSLSARSGVPMQWVRWWRAKSKLLEGAATYRWGDDIVTDRSGRAVRVIAARVSEEFFPLIGTGTSTGRTFHPGDYNSCRDCILLSYDFWRRNYADRPSSVVTLGGQRYRVLGVLDKSFWFLSRHIAVWSLAGNSELAPETRTGVVVRLGPDVTRKSAQAEMSNILVEEAGFSAWDSLVDVSMVHQRVHSVFGSFALGLVLAVVMAVAGLRPRMPKFGSGSCARALFFNCKTGLALMAVLLAGLEFTHAPSITMIGGTDLTTEPLSTWLFLIGSMGVLTWSIFDQRRRCRVCLRRLGMAAHVGCPGCLLLNWAGTELVCIEGHGMLHVPEMTSSWQDAERWTALDESWMQLFGR